MTQNSLQTECPNCHTRFRVTDEQLGVAKGKVRCGHCMEIFNALEHQVAATPGPRPAAPEPSETTSARDWSPPHSDDEDIIFADNPEEDAAEGRYAGTRLTFSEDELSDSFLSIDQQPGPDFKDADDEPEPEQIDESWAEAILNEDEPVRPARDRDTPPEGDNRAASAATDRPSTPPAPETPDTSEWHLSARPEDRPAPAAGAPTSPAPGPTAPATGAASTPEDDTPIRATVPFGDLRREPVSVAGGRSSRTRTLLWSLVVIALLGLLVAQVTWFQFDRLSAIPELRPFYEKGCELAGCQLKPLVNVAAIQSRKLVVRTDPDNRSQLLVDAVIINRADFEQPFPAIALTFSNLNGDVVAQSIFTPEEYLAGEARELDSMPIDTPVRIAIRIRDPGRDAVNYNLDFRPHPP